MGPVLPRPPVTGLPPSIARDRCLVMGVLNVTPDSFSDGGRYLDPDAAVDHAAQMLAAGADIVDVGAESTRPGAEQVPPSEQLRRLTDVVTRVVAAGAVVSVDTTSVAVAEAALAAGAAVVNDVSGGLADPGMFRLLAQARVPYVLMHWRGHSDRMNRLAVYDDVVREVHDELAARLDAFERAGADVDQVILDPGLGFAKDADHNWRLLAGLEAFVDLGRPVLIGASRKRFLGSLPARPPLPGEPHDRDAATAAVSALSAAQDAWGVRVHAVAPTVDAVRTVEAIRLAGVS